MRIELCPSGVEWIDSNLGGVPMLQPSVVLGDARSGKTCLAVSFALASLRRGPTCFVTTDVPEAVLELAATFLEHDLSPYLRTRQLTLLRFSSFFEQKVRSLRSIERPFSELAGVIRERKIQSLVFDGFDPVLSWMEPANAKPLARNVVATLGRLGVTSLCTLRGKPDDIEVGPEAFASLVSGAFELDVGRLKGRDVRRLLRVRFASWCNVEGIEVPFDLVQGQGFVAHEREPSVIERARPPFAPDADVRTHRDLMVMTHHPQGAPQSARPPAVETLGKMPVVRSIVDEEPAPAASSRPSSPPPYAPPPPPSPFPITSPSSEKTLVDFRRPPPPSSPTTQRPTPVSRPPISYRPARTSSRPPPPYPSGSSSSRPPPPASRAPQPPLPPANRPSAPPRSSARPPLPPKKPSA